MMSFISPNRIFRCLALLTVLFVADHPAWSQSNLGYIMPIGDSITEGYDATGNLGGWRTPLYSDLVSAGYSFTYEGDHNTFSPILFSAPVGGSSDGSTLLVNNGESYNNGWSGATMVKETSNTSTQVNIQSNLTSWFSSPDLIPSAGSAVLPKIVTLEIGTNDILGGNLVVSSLLADLQMNISTILSLDPTADLIVAQITPLDGSDAAYNPTVISFNAGIPALVNAEDLLGNHVSMVDLYDLIPTNGSEQYDGVHPNVAGNAAIATAYANAIEALPEPPVLALLIPGAAVLLFLGRRLGRASSL